MDLTGGKREMVRRWKTRKGQEKKSKEMREWTKTDEKEEKEAEMANGKDREA